MNKNKSISFERKKICKTGIYTCSLSLPKVWLHNARLNVGDELDVEMNSDGSLTLRPVKKE